MLSLKDEQRGDVVLKTSLPPLAGYLRNHAHWIPVGFKPLVVRPLDSDTYRLQLPEFGALGFQLAPQMALRQIEDNECHYRLVSVPMPELDYEVGFDGLFRLAPTPESVGVFWEVRFAIALEAPGFLQMLPQAMVQGAAQAAVRAMTSSVCHSLVDNICRDYRSRSHQA